VSAGRLGAAIAEPNRREGVLNFMDQTIYGEPSEVEAKDGAVEVDGPDDVDVAMTPEAAEETSERLIAEAVRARGQRRLSRLIHRSK